MRVDRGAFLDCYARLMMRFTKLTPHQRETLEAVRGAHVALLLAPAGGGKTFVAVQRMLEAIHGGGKVLFAARNAALALFAVKWVIVAAGTSASRVADRVHVLVAPFGRGPRAVRVEEAGGRRKLVLEEGGRSVDRFALVVVDGAHPLGGDAAAHVHPERDGDHGGAG